MDKFRANKPTGFEEITWSATFAVTGAAVIVINALAFFTFITTASLRTRKHIMIINLIITDLLFGVAGMSSTVYYLKKPTNVAYYIMQVLNRFPKMASLFTLGVIAVERMHAIVWPIRHHVLENRVYKAAVVFIWVLAAVMTTFLTIELAADGDKISMRLSGAFVTLVVFGVITAITACYISIWISLRRRKRRKRSALAKHDKALAITLLVVAGTFMVTWVIPMLYLSISRMCKGCHQLSVAVMMWLRMVFALQSVVNPIIYCFRIAEFKERWKAYAGKVKCFKDKGQQPTVVSQITRASRNEANNSKMAF